MKIFVVRRALSNFVFIVLAFMGEFSAKDVDDITASFSEKISIHSEEKLKKLEKEEQASRQYYLERRNGDLLAQYTNNITFDDINGQNRTFLLDEAGAVAKNQNLTELQGAQSHLLAYGFCYHSDDRSSTEIRTSLDIPQIPRGAGEIVDWVSYTLDAPNNGGYYSRVTPQNVFGGHSEPNFIDDINALWTQNYTSVLKFLVPAAIFHGNQDIYMTGIELFGSFDMCSSYYGSGNNRYNCIGSLVNFRNQHQQGQQSISQAVRNLMRDRFVGGADSRGFVLAYHATLPYTNSADYNAAAGNDSPQMRWNGNNFNMVEGGNPIVNNDMLSQYEQVTEAPSILYGHIHSLTNRNLNYVDGIFNAL
jgi:hypothetical protein